MGQSKNQFKCGFAKNFHRFDTFSRCKWCTVSQMKMNNRIYSRLFADAKRFDIAFLPSTPPPRPHHPPPPIHINGLYNIYLCLWLGQFGSIDFVCVWVFVLSLPGFAFPLTFSRVWMRVWTESLRESLVVLLKTASLAEIPCPDTCAIATFSASFLVFSFSARNKIAINRYFFLCFRLLVCRGTFTDSLTEWW